VQRIGVMTKLLNEEGKNPIKIFPDIEEGSSDNTHEDHWHSS